MLNLKKFMRKKRKKINKAKKELKFQIEWKQIAKECSEKQARKESMFGRRQNSIIKGCLHDEYYNKYSH